MNGLFGLELPTSVNFVIAFVVVLGLIGAATWLVRRFGVSRLEATGRNRQPRLAVIDSAAVDGRRKLVIIRRDNVEHLLMIGGPTDVVVETNIVRSGVAASREAPAVRVNGGDTLPRAMPLPDQTSWPLQPEPVAPSPAPPVRAERARPPAEDAAHWPLQAEPAAPEAPPVHAQRADPLEGLAADMAPPAAAPPRPAPPQAPRAPARKGVAALVADRQVLAASDQNLANMAFQLEAALRRPAQPVAELTRIEPKLAAARPQPVPRAAAEPVPRVEAAPASTPAPAPQPVPQAEPKVAAAPAAAPAKPTYESIEEEMASLLGRPGKT